jgi:hypothetical protein
MMSRRLTISVTGRRRGGQRRDIFFAAIAFLVLAHRQENVSISSSPVSFSEFLEPMRQSAGTLLYRQGPEGLEVVLVHAAGAYNRKAP